MVPSSGTSAPVLATCFGEPWRETVLDTEVRRSLARHGQLADLDPGTLRAADGTPVHLDAVRVLVTGWGSPRLDSHVLDRLPALGLVAHAAGSVRGLVTDAVWQRGIRVCSATAANAVPVADFTVAQIQLALKNAWRLTAGGNIVTPARPRSQVRGVVGATIGLVGLGHIGGLVARKLADEPVTVLAYDPHVGAQDARELGLTLAGLKELVAASDVVSLHAPLTEETRGMIDEALLNRMRPHATLINTARGAVVDTDALVTALRGRPDLLALLDVTDPEPLPADHPLLGLPNVYVTPHIAGSLGTEEARLGALVAQETARFLHGLPLAHEVEQTRLDRTA